MRYIYPFCGLNLEWIEPRIEPWIEPRSHLNPLRLI